MSRTILKNDFPILVFVSLLFFLLIFHDLNSWYYSAIGDEYAFFHFARDIAENRVRLSVLPAQNSLSIFSQDGVYRHAPVLSSLYQALVMKFFGINHTSWIVSSILLVVSSFWFYFYLVKDWCGRMIAWIALLMLASSHYLWAFTHLGYWNINVFLPFWAAFFFFFRGLKQERVFLMFLAGLFSALGFYSYYSDRITIILLTIFVLFNFKKILRQKRLILVFYLGFLTLFSPFVLINKNEDILSRMLEKSLVGTEEIKPDQRLLLGGRNLWGSFWSFYQNSQVSHFVSGSLIDPLSAVLFTIGVLLMVWKWRKYYFVLLCFLAILIGAGGFSPYPYPPITRLFFILPVIFWMASYALLKLSGFFKKTRLCYSIVGLVLIFILGINLHRFYRVTPFKMRLTPEAVIMRVLQEDCPGQPTFILHPEPEPLLEPALSAFGFSPSPQAVRPAIFGSLDWLRYHCLIFVEKPDNFPTYTVSDWSGKTQVYVFSK